MKKILSMLLAVCTLASFVTVASAAETPTMKLVAEKITFDGEYASYANKYDWSKYGCDTYSLKLIATGMEIKTEEVVDGRSSIYVGDSITGYQVDISADATGLQYNLDWKWGLINHIAAPSVGAPDANGAILALTATNPLEPAAEVAKAIGKDDEVEILEFLVTVDATKQVTFKLNDFSLFLCEYEDMTMPATGNYAYNASNGTMVTTTPSITLPVAEEKVTTAEVVKEYNFVETAGGYAWDVLIKNFDSTKTYATIFKAGEETREVGDNELTVNAYAEADGSDLGFVVLMKTSKENVTLDIKVQ